MGAIILAGCHKSEPAPAAPPGVKTEVVRGPLHMVVEATPAPVWIGDAISVRISVHTPEEMQIAFPGSGAFGELNVRAMDSPPAKPSPGGGRDWQAEYRIDTSQSGKLEIPALTVKYSRTDGAKDASAEMVSDVLQVEVRSALTSQDSMATPREITGVLTPGAAPLSWKRLAGLVAIAAAAAILAVLLVPRLWRRMHKPPPPISPEDWALQGLAALNPASVTAGDPRPFYYRISEIVRVYIERKFGLAAAEMTTEEFLRSASSGRTPLPYDAGKLRPFLQACDIVKYAAFDPRVEDAEEALRTARDFVQSTAASWALAQRIQQQAGLQPPAQASGRAA